MAGFQGGVGGYPLAPAAPGSAGPGMVPGMGGGWNAFGNPQTWAGANDIGSVNTAMSGQMTNFAGAQEAIQNFMNESNIRLGFQSVMQSILAQSESLGQTISANEQKISKGWASMAQNAV